MKKMKRKTAAEAMAEFEKDPGFVERRRQRDEEFRRKEEQYERAEARLVEELRVAGVSVGSVWDLVNTRNAFPQSLPILLKHLAQPYPDAVKEGIARAMAVPEARFAWPALVASFCKETAGRTKDGLAVALSNVADDDLLGELVELARDSSHGESRLLLLNALERSKHPDARKALMGLGADPDLHREVQRVLRRRKSRSA